MACKTETKQIGEHEYSVTQWNAEKAILMKMKLIKFLGPAVATIAEALKDDSKGKSKGGGETDSIGKAIALMFENNSPEDVTAFIKASIVGVAFNEKRITETSFNEIFSGDDLADVYKVFAMVIQVNYSNLLKGQLVKDLLAKAKKSL